MKKVELYQIAYSQETLLNIAPDYLLLNNIENSRSDWREYWPIRKFLLQQELDDDKYYGFFSPRFQSKTGLSYNQVINFIQSNQQDTDIFILSPQPDMGAFFLNIFEQNELFDPGFTAASEAFFSSIGISIKLDRLVMDSRQIVFSNYIIARPTFWRAWLDISEKLFEICEGEDSPLKQLLVFETTYPGAVQRKVFLIERIASFLISIHREWRVKAYNTFEFAWSSTRLNQFRLEAVLSDALKIAIREQGFSSYIDAYFAVRDKLR